MADTTLTVRAGALTSTSMRYHELAIQYWLNHLFFVREGYSVPVVFSNPMDAFAQFQQLFDSATNPYAYLYGVKDNSGAPLYQPSPAQIKYPIISVHRKGWKYRSYQNFSIHRWRHINWPTVSDTGSHLYGKEQIGVGLDKCELGNVTTSRMPMAWDYRFQIDHFCNRPDTQAFFIEQLMQEFWRTGGIPQTWIKVIYPGWGERLVRLFIEGDVESVTPEQPEDGKNVEFRTSFTVTLEGFDVDLRFQIYPALWYILFRSGPIDPSTLSDAFEFVDTQDVRIRNDNVTLDSRPDVPPGDNCSNELFQPGVTDPLPVVLESYDNRPNNNFGQFTVTLV